MKVVSVAGHRNAGKTSLVEALLQAFSPDVHVATIKSIHHEVDFDMEGTDTYRHRIAGADTVIGVTPTLTAEFRTVGKNDGVTLEDRLVELETRDVDWTIVEGFKEAAVPTILVGDIDESAVGGRVLFRLRDGTAVDGSRIRERLDSVPVWKPETRSDRP